MLKVTNISKSFILSEKVLDDISFDINKGELVSVLGSNGSGKSTLLKILSGFYNSDTGSFSLSDKVLTGLPTYIISQQFHYLHQSREDNLPPSLTLLEATMVCLSNASSDFHSLSVNQWTKKTIDLFSPLDLNLENKIDQQIKSFSGGECQVVSLVLMIEIIKQNSALENILLLDEHTAHLDNNMAAKVMDLTIQLVKENQITTIMVTHNIEAAIKFSDRVLILKNKKVFREITFNSTRRQITKSELENLVLN
ncbi:MAG: ATP-binding cassette domain-containing protein [Bacteroidetes bacterium]|nr:ATP-binding cassette domain-containing protein [Bacteroidota bacterium]